MFTKRQQEIINATMELLCEYGMKAVTTRKIAARIKIKEASLYNHFASKEKILEGVIDYLSEVVSNDILARYADKNSKGIEIIEKGYLAWCDMYTKNPAMAYLIINAGTIFREYKDLLEKIKGLKDAEYKRILEAVKEAQKSGDIRKDIDARSTALLIAGVFATLLINWMNSDKDFDLSGKSKLVWKNLKKMLAP